jgi:hypothetical protein
MTARPRLVVLGAGFGCTNGKNIGTRVAGRVA